jgi:hypothetical protein
MQVSLSSPFGLVLFLGFAELAVMFFFFALLLEPCNFVALVMKFGQKPLMEKLAIEAQDFSDGTKL